MFLNRLWMSTMWSREFQWSVTRFLQSASNRALAFFGASCLVLLVVGGVVFGLIEVGRFTPASERFVFPPAFLVSSIMLAGGSWKLHRAAFFVRRERQVQFRRSLAAALLLGTLFVGVQLYGLWCLLLSQRASEETIGLWHGAFAFALMHGLHFVVALLFVVFVMLMALADRYDHEYSWGVTFCAWFWHALGIVWLAIMGGFLVASTIVPPPGPMN